MRTDNEQLALDFVQGHTEGVGSNMFIDKDTIYSYGYHFPIVRRIYDMIYLYNPETYSNTTSRHQNIVREKIENQEGIIIDLSYCDTNLIFKQYHDNKDIISSLKMWNPRKSEKFLEKVRLLKYYRQQNGLLLHLNHLLRKGYN